MSANNSFLGQKKGASSITNGLLAEGSSEQTIPNKKTFNISESYLKNHIDAMSVLSG